MVRELGPDLEARFPEAQVIVAPFAQGPPVDAPVGFRIVGPSLRLLAEKGAELRQVMHQMPEVTHSRASVASRAKLAFTADQTRVELAGMSLSSVAQQLQGNLEGFTGGSVREDLEELPVRIRYDNAVRSSLADIASMPLLPAGAERWVPADALGSMQVEPEAASITRRNGERVNIVHGWVVPGALPIEVSNRVLARLDAAGFSLPPGYRLELEGDSDAQRDAVAKLTTYLPVLLMLMLATLVMSFRSVVSAAIVALVAVLSAGLGMLSLWLSGFKLGFNPLLGSAGLVGVAINGAIVVLAGLRADADAKSGNVDAIVRVVQREARHVLATTATTMGGFVPLLVFSGGEFWPPLAVVMAGGVGLSVILSLVLTPALVTLVVRRRARQRAAAALPQAASVLLLLLIAGCAVGPDYEPPDTSLTDEWIGVDAAAVAEPLNDWWRSFDDPLIEQYVETALTANRDLRVAGAGGLREARALREQARSLFLPNVNATLGYNRFTLSEDSPFLAGSGLEGAQTSSLYDAGFDAAWELDVFGGIRRRNESAVAVTEATEAFVDAVRLSIIAEVVRSFAELRGFQRRLEVAERNLRLQDETLTLVEGRVASGLAPELDALNARAQLYATRSTLPQLEAAIRSSIFRLATLTARTPGRIAR